MKSNHEKRTYKTRTIGSALLALSLTMTSLPIAMAAESGNTTNNQVVTASGVSPMFSDVKLGHWAEKHIHKLAALGILKGNNGKFRPGDDVTQQEAITMAIRFMGLEGELNTTETVALPADFKVGAYFKPYVVLAFQKGLLDKKEEMTNPDPKKPWGDEKATREWVAKILVRAIGKEAEAKSQNNPTSFADNNKISSDALGYVNTAVDLKLTTGMAGNRFEPQGKVTRDQLATFFSRGDKIASIQHAAENYGYAMSLSDQEIRLYTEDGKSQTYRRDSKTMYYKGDGEESIKASDIALYTKIRVAGEGGVASYVELIDADPKVETTRATLKYVVASDNKFYVKSDGTEDLTEVFYDNTTVIKDASGNSIDASKMTTDSVLEMKRETFTSERKIIEIQVKSGPVNKSGKGTIVSVDATNKSITIQPDSGDNETFTVADDVIVRYEDQILSNGIKDLKENNTITYVVKNSIVQSIELTELAEMTITGTLYEKGAAKTSLTVKKDNGKLEAKMLARDVEIVMEGMNNPSFDDLIAGEYGDRVELTMNSEDLVSRITAVNRKVEMLIGVTILNYDKTNSLLTVVDEKKDPYVLSLNPGTRFENNGNRVSLDDIASDLRGGKRKANIQYTAKNALLVQFVNKYEGTFVFASTTAKKVTMKLANDQSVTLPYMYTTLSVEKYGKSNMSLSDLNNGDKIVAYLTDDQTTISSLAVRQTEQFEVVSRDTSANRIRLRSAGTTIEEFYVGGVPVYDLKNNRIKLEDIKPNDFVNAVLDGRSITEVRQVQVTYGRVDSVDTNTGVVTVRDNAGNLSVHQVGKNAQIQVDQSTASLSTLKTGDRVEVRKDVKDLPVVKLVSGTKRSFWRYDSKSGELYVKRSLAENNYIFKVHPNAHIHSSGNKIDLSSLKEDAEIMLYFVNNQVVEIEKLS
ncbi:S-layer homology domain-containing protein [Paenibacillus apiarius]|uniref:S-layer homology domain-containing protein n=1 Tax=Paenibacillus apiarius TaxID=46240 RepID=A0ABT4DVH0_9BACL|nr:S-layer homology domain-containing protein [Paenibacillus apiarius]MCY9515845.1 S-layer homology domain-containing protein [Paenibacillus apiarius]MCY9520755.1 S-layer homology domain-containing protein [Paenibacillus apiarius]MCY9553459.1 S-layer homology domain-containing protein [Paenibacillus apiarius]MCY9558017.1 S-layer homology domain-containing protein [Paenibacillus apiarius]MCY9685872.1 S-layer homology domain-containing protein [Paenibacillus apiarius]